MGRAAHHDGTRSSLLSEDRLLDVDDIHWREREIDVSPIDSAAQGNSTH